MLRFEKKNVNPKERKTGDCAIRGIVSCTGYDYDVVLVDMFRIVLKTKYAFASREVIERLMVKYGWVKFKQPRKADNTKYKVCEMDRVLSEEQKSKGVLCIVANHCVAIKDDYYIDSWDSGRKCVGNYYVFSKQS